jgi:hypothetical protein
MTLLNQTLGGLNLRLKFFPGVPQIVHLGDYEKLPSWNATLHPLRQKNGSGARVNFNSSFHESHGHSKTYKRKESLPIEIFPEDFKTTCGNSERKKAGHHGLTHQGSQQKADAQVRAAA